VTQENERPAPTEVERYALGLLAEEAAEIVQLIGKALRFGIDTPGVRDPLTGVVDPTVTARTRLEVECGDMIAAMIYAYVRGLIDYAKVSDLAHAKLDKLLSPDSKDNLGRRLAP